LIASLVGARVAPVEEVTIALDLAGSATGPSRGTLRSALANLDTLTTGGEVYDRGKWRLDAPVRRTSLVFPRDSSPSPVARFAVPGVFTVPRHLAANWVEGVARPELVAAFGSVTPELIDKLPEGPAAEHRRASRFVVIVIAVGTDGSHARGVVEGSDMYGTTAVIAVEAARRLVTDSPKPGLLAPAQAYDPTDFLDFLVPTASAGPLNRRASYQDRSGLVDDETRDPDADRCRRQSSAGGAVRSSSSRHRVGHLLVGLLIVAAARSRI